MRKPKFFEELCWGKKTRKPPFFEELCWEKRRAGPPSWKNFVEKQGDACERHNPQRRFAFLIFPPLLCKWSHFQRGEFTWEEFILSGPL